jgi:two-component system, NarL family, nitrate/nitrite response regulator NarL
MNTSVRIFIADDHKLMLEGLATLIQSIEGFSLVGKVSSGKALIGSLERMAALPDICIVDIEMPEMDGIETVKVIRQKFPEIKIMALTMHKEAHFVNRMITAGANGYLLKNVDREVFIESIHKILGNSDFITEGISAGKPVQPVQDDELTQRERQILRLIVQGKNNKEIGEELFISDRTADTHRTNIKRKLKISTLAQLMQYAKTHNLTDF